MMKRSITTTKSLTASLVLGSIFVAGLLIVCPTVIATATPIKGIGVVIKKIPDGKASNARTNQDGKFTVAGLEPGIYTISMKHAPEGPSNLKTAVITIQEAKGRTGHVTLIKKIPMVELGRGVTFEIEIEGPTAATITGTCVVTDED